MITNQRKEPFRYSFRQPYPFDLYIESIDGKPAPFKPVQALLFDISRQGCQISLPLALKANDHRIAVSMELMLHEEPLRLRGELRWERLNGDRYQYGIRLHIPEQDRERLPRELRALAGERKIFVK